MGADLPPCRPGQGNGPDVRVWAVKDPTSANLDRIQIIKGWTKNGQSFEKIFDVAWSGDRKPDKWSGRVPAIQSTVDIDNATYENSVGSTNSRRSGRIRVRPEPARVLLRPRTGDPDAPVDPHPGRETRPPSARYRAADRAGARLDFADLVRAAADLARTRRPE